MAKRNEYPATLPAYETLVSNMVSCFGKASPAQVVAGMRWYDEAREWCRALATATPYSLEQIIAVVAILSPKANWVENKKMATMYVDAHQRGDKEMPVCMAYTVNRAKAWRVLSGAPISENCRGIKVEEFQANITGDNGRVTVDRHHWTASTGTRWSDMRKSGGITAPENRVIAAATLEAASICGVVPSAFQAILWCVVRGNLGE